MFKLADRYIAIHFLSKSFMTMLVFIIIFLLVDIVENLDKIIDADIPRFIIYKYYFYALPWYISLGLPMALLLGTVFTTGLLQKNNELIAIKSAGISIKRICTPLLVLGLLFSIFSFFYDNLLVTDCMQKRTEISSKYNLVRSKNNSMKQKNIFRQESSNEILGIHRFTFRNQSAHNVSIQKFEDGNLTSRLDIPLMKWNTTNNNWQFNKFYSRIWIDDSILYNEWKQDTSVTLNFNPTELTQATVKPEEMNYWELKRFVNKLKEYGVKDPKWKVNMYFKSSFACTSFLMILFGLSLSIRRPRSNLAVGIGISILVIFIYYAAITTGRSLGYKGTLDPFISVWLTNLIFFCIGSILFKKIRS